MLRHVDFDIVVRNEEYLVILKEIEDSVGLFDMI
jgi:hypothetical protein